MTRNLEPHSRRGQDATMWGVSDRSNPAPLRIDENGNLFVVFADPVEAGDEGQVLETDSISRALVVLEIEHHQVHLGYMFSASYVNLALGNGASIDFRLPTGSGFCHFSFDAECGGNGEVQFYEQANLSGGTPITPVNLKRQDTGAIAPTLTVYHTPAVNAVGTQLYNGVLAGGRGPQAGGGQARERSEWVLAQNRVYLIRLYNRSGGAQPASLVVQWYERTTN